LNSFKRSRIALLLILAFVMTAPGFAFGTHTGSAAGIIGGFEIDGNKTFDSLLGATRDWDNVATSSPWVEYATQTDLFNTQSDTAFSGGDKEAEPDKWDFIEHSAPGKDDLTAGYAAAEVTNTVAWLWLAFERLPVSGVGDAHIDFELNQSTSTVVNSVGETIPARATGDLLIQYDYPGGTSPVDISVLEWTGNAVTGSFSDVTPPASAVVADASPDRERTFGEVGLDLTQVVGFLDCPGFNQFWTKSRASGESDTSQLKDVIMPTPIDLSTCGSITVLKEDESGTKLAGATFEAFFDDGDDTFEPGVDTLIGTCVTGVSGTCTFDRVDPGTYFVREIGVPDGYVGDTSVKQVEVTFRADVTVGPFINKKIQYRLSLVPVEDTNLVNNDHVFTAHLETCSAGIAGCQNEANWSDATSEVVSLALTGMGSITGITPAGPNATSCTTDSNGECQITIRSADPGRSTLTASFDKQTSSTPINLDSSAIKDWVNYRITICCEATNLVGTTHTFTALLEKTTNGTTWTVVPGATLNLSKTAGVGSITSGATCTTSAAGSCPVMVTSATPGDTTVQAAYNAVVGNTSATFSATAVKHWVDYRITVNPDGVNLVGAPHTFTVTLQRNAGSGLTALPGAQVSLAWSGVAGSTIVSGGVVAPDGQSATCTTSAAGTCTIVVNSSASGSGTLTGTFSTVLDSGPATFNDSATKKWVNYTITVTPKTDRNLLPVEPNHTFLVKLASTDGSSAPIGGQPIDLGLASSVATITAITPGGVIDVGNMAGGCVTDSQGECLVTITTSGPGEATLTAIYETIISSASLTISDDGSKEWITYRISVVPEQATNLVNQAHTFTVKIESTVDGSNWSPVVGVTPDIDLDGAGGITGGTCISGVTNASGECTVTVNSAETGVATVTAEYEATEGSASFTFSDSGQKTWINYALEVTPAEATNLVGTQHIFTVKIWKDAGDGEGFQVLAGAIPSISLTGPGSIVTNNCTAGTSAAGTCTVIVTSDVTGLATLSATYLGVADSGSAPFTDTGDKLWVNYRLDVSPEVADNPVNTDHVFTVTLEKDEGQGFQSLSGATVSLTLTGAGSNTDISDGSFASDGRSGTCTTDASGQCFVTITSSEPGQSTLTAVHLATVASTSRSFPDSGVKNWISNPAIQIVKTVNPISGTPGTPVTYTFVVTNIGDVTLFEITVIDDKLGHICNIAELGVGDSAECTKGSTLGTIGVRNVAVARGHDLLGRFVEDDDDAVVSVVEPARFERPPPAAILPVTGLDNGAPLGASGFALIAAGLLVLAYERRRTRARASI
jgi:hypothetical protein